jgi:hypothetical protein
MLHVGILIVQRFAVGDGDFNSFWA